MLKRQDEGTLPFEGFTLYNPRVLIRKISSEPNLIYKIPKVHIASAHPANFRFIHILVSGHAIQFLLGKYCLYFLLCNP